MLKIERPLSEQEVIQALNVAEFFLHQAREILRTVSIAPDKAITEFIYNRVEDASVRATEALRSTKEAIEG